MRHAPIHDSGSASLGRSKTERPVQTHGEGAAAAESHTATTDAMFRSRLMSYVRAVNDQAVPLTGCGERYEDLLDYVLSSVPGCRVQRNTLNHYRTEEVDLTIANDRLCNGLRMLPELFLVECKNWSVPVDSTTIGYFVNVIADRGCSLGILAAAKGITGRPEHRSRAYAIGAAALVRGLRLLVITQDDIMRLNSPMDVVTLLHHRNHSLTAHGTIHLG